MRGVISVHDAERLDYLMRLAGRPWTPAPGDRFMIPGRDLDDVFVIAEMTIEVDDLPGGRHIRFNGTTEWALDSIAVHDVLWLPWEHQLRALLEERFARLERDGSTYAVALTDGSVHRADDAESAYLAALLADSGV
jgi:hypothetical protein